MRISSVLACALVLAIAGCGTTGAGPSPLAIATGPATPSAAPTTPASPTPLPRSAEEAATALARALAARDETPLRAIVSPRGWTAAYYSSEGIAPMSPADTVAWLHARASGGLDAAVDARAVLAADPAYDPPGDRVVLSTWRGFDHVASQRVDLVLRDEGGVWYWSGALFNAPR